MRRAARRIRALAFAVTLAAAGSAGASLTPSEQVLVRGWVAGAQRQNVARVRAVVARPDLSADESAAALSQALTAAPVTDARIVFLRELVFGAGSRASRSVLAAAVTRALVARADAVFDHTPASALDRPGPAAAELLRIYAFLAGDVADAGAPPSGRAHDIQAGIDEATYATCAQTLGAHLKRHAAFLRPGPALSPAAARVRAQAMLAAFDMGADSPTRVIDAMDRIGLDAARRRLLIERGVLLLDSGKSAPALAAATAMIRRLPGSALAGVEAIVLGAETGGLRARETVLAVGGELDGAARAEGFPAGEVAPSPVPRALGELARELALAVARHALASHGSLRLAVQRDVQSAGGDASKLLGPAGDGSPEAGAASALGMLMIDAPRTIDLAMARFLGGRPESAALLSDAIGVLAAGAGPSGVQALVLGKGGDDGSITPLPLSGVHLQPNGTAAGFGLGGARWEIVRDPAGTVSGVHRDRQPLAFTMLRAARIPVSGGASWTGGGLALRALYGSPLVGVVHGPRIRIEGRGDLDAVALSAPGDDASFDADVRGEGSFAVLLRAKSGPGGVGIGVRVVPGDGRRPARVAIVNVAAGGGERELAQSTALAQVDHVHVAVHGAKIRAVCTRRGRPPQTASLEAPVPAHQAHGDVAILVKKGTSLELSGVAVRRN
jgi:hypothetical protein